MFSVTSEYAKTAAVGQAFVDLYYGRLNDTPNTLHDLFADWSRYYGMDSLDHRPAVGLTEISRIIMKYRDAKAINKNSVGTPNDVGGRNGRGTSRQQNKSQQQQKDAKTNPVVVVKSVDTQRSWSNTYETAGTIERDYMVFVEAEWTQESGVATWNVGRQRSCQSAKFPFVQTFEIRATPATPTVGNNGAFQFIVISTVVKNIRRTVKTQHKLRSENCRIQKPKAHELVSARPINVMDRNRVFNRTYEAWPNQEYPNYQNKVSRFLQKNDVDNRVAFSNNGKRWTTIQPNRPFYTVHLLVHQLLEGTTKTELHRVFLKFGEIYDIQFLQLGSNRRKNRNKRCCPMRSAFIEFYQTASVELAIAYIKPIWIRNVKIAYERYIPKN